MAQIEAVKRRPRRVLWTVAILASALVGVAGLRLGIPYAMVSLGIGADYGWSAFRAGHREAHYLLDLIGDWPEGTNSRRRRTSGPIFANSGERFRLHYAVEPRRGQVTLVLDEILGGGMTPIWRTAFKQAAEGTVDVHIPVTGLYSLRLLFIDYKGRVKVDWHVE